MRSAAKRGRGRGRKTRWLVRRDNVDYGPYNDEEVFECFVRKEINLGSLITPAGTQQWKPAGEYPQFRDRMVELQKRWDEIALEEEVEAAEQKLKTKQAVSGGAWKLIVVGLIVFAGLGSWIIYRIVHAEPTGIMDAVNIPDLQILPEPPAAAAKAPQLTLAQATKVKRLREFTNYDTSGVGMEGSGPAPESRFEFDESGNAVGGPGLSQAALNKIINKAQGGLVRCAQKAAERSSSFKGTKVSFLVKPGRLGSFTVGRSAIKNAPFKACVKAALKRVSVPQFGGSDRRVTIPLAIR